jgi:hypothetical protein
MQEHIYSIVAHSVIWKFVVRLANTVFADLIIKVAGIWINRWFERRETRRHAVKPSYRIEIDVIYKADEAKREPESRRPRVSRIHVQDWII